VPRYWVSFLIYDENRGRYVWGLDAVELGSEDGVYEYLRKRYGARTIERIPRGPDIYILSIEGGRDG